MSYPPELAALVQAVAADQPTPAEQLAAIARWRLGCGDGRGAARWHRWSLDMPPAPVVRSALEALLLPLNQPSLASQLGQAQGWSAVLQSLEAGDPELAVQNQAAAIAAAAEIDVPLCLRLASLWQQQRHPEPALELLRAIAAQAATPALCNAIAHLHEQQQQPDQAAPWWDHSLSLDSRQPAALMQRSRNALALGDAGLACHLAMALLELDPHHAVAQELQVDTLARLGAPASQRLALAVLVRQGRDRYRSQAQTLEAWWRPRRRRQSQWRLQLEHSAGLQPVAPPRPLPPSALADCRCIGLLGSRDGLELAGWPPEAGATGVVWNLASREPLVSQRNLQRLLPEGWQLRRWPRWQPSVHGALEALVIADPRLSPPAEAPERVLRPGQAG